jgi:hypothetical protein
MANLDLLPREHPEFDLATLPAIPENWEDTSWHNDTCPSWQAPNGLRIFVDYADPEQREIPECERFSVHHDTDGGVDIIAFGDDWSEILLAVASFEGRVTC